MGETEEQKHERWIRERELEENTTTGTGNAVSPVGVFTKDIKQKRWCFDLDGTLCTEDGQGNYPLAEPIEEAIQFVRDRKAAGDYIIIDTARGTMTCLDWNALSHWQLQRWDVPYDELHCGRKPFADVYVDDRSCSPDVMAGNYSGPPRSIDGVLPDIPFSVPMPPVKKPLSESHTSIIVKELRIHADRIIEEIQELGTEITQAIRGS